MVKDELEKITKKRVGRTLEVLDLACCGEMVKMAVKKQFWEMKNEIESRVLESKGEDNDEEHSL